MKTTKQQIQERAQALADRKLKELNALIERRSEFTSEQDYYHQLTQLSSKIKQAQNLILKSFEH